MAYSSDDKQEVLGAVVVGACSELRVTSVSDDSGLKAIDIRNWYCTQKDPEMKPTYKGVRIKKENLVEILSLILDNLDEDTLNQLHDEWLS